MRLTPTNSVRRASLTAAASLLAMAFIAGFAHFFLLTAESPIALFRLGVASFVVVVILDIVVAWALLTVLIVIDQGWAILAAWFRVAFAAVFAVAIGVLAQPLPGSADGTFRASTLETFDAIWTVGLILFGMHLLVVGVLVAGPSVAEKVVGILLVIAGLGYVVDGFGFVLMPELSVAVSEYTFVGEVVFIGWLFVKGGARGWPRARSHVTPAATATEGEK
ncbi:DUF4386 domain-containing protein [Luethyella okanaganae]|uniref:DUF4386 domain-containing protein n=1 Tax=Luethyella okanaganae TaxID=69372 RepID=A0ABW1VKB2_9MICO